MDSISVQLSGGVGVRSSIGGPGGSQGSPWCWREHRWSRPAPAR